MYLNNLFNFFLFNFKLTNCRISFSTIANSILNMFRKIQKNFVYELLPLLEYFSNLPIYPYTRIQLVQTERHRLVKFQCGNKLPYFRT